MKLNYSTVAGPNTGTQIAGKSAILLFFENIEIAESGQFRYFSKKSCGGKKMPENGSNEQFHQPKIATKGYKRYICIKIAGFPILVVSFLFDSRKGSD